jgi:hypothetical protein
MVFAKYLVPVTHGERERERERERDRENYHRKDDIEINQMAHVRVGS